MPTPGQIFDTRSVRVPPLHGHSLIRFLFPGTIQLGRARESVLTDRLAFLIHGLTMNEDYFGLLAPEVVAKGYDVWALRLPGYLGSGETPSLRDLHVSLSLTLYGWVVASAMAHVVNELRPRPTHVLAWGQSLGAAALATALTGYAGAEWPGPDRLVFEAPAFAEAIAFSGRLVAGFSAAPDTVLDTLARAFLMDDLRSSECANLQGSPLVPGRTSRTVFTMNVLALTHPFARTPRLSSEWLERSWFVMGSLDRLVDPDRLARLPDDWNVACGRRLVLPRNHLLSLTVAREMVDWLEQT